MRQMKKRKRFLAALVSLAMLGAAVPVWAEPEDEAPEAVTDAAAEDAAVVQEDTEEIVFDAGDEADEAVEDEVNENDDIETIYNISDYSAELLNADSLLSVAYGECDTSVGYKQQEYNNWTKYGEWMGAGYMDWCAAFVAWCANQAGISSDIIPHYSFVNDMISFYSNRGLYHSVNSYIPKAGDLAFLKDFEHVAIVISANSSSVTTIEGNTSRPDFTGQSLYVSIKTRSVSYFKGFASPAYISDNMNPTIEDFYVTEKDATGYTVYAVVKDETMLNHVTFFDWTVNAPNGNDQDDIKQEDVLITGQDWGLSHRVNISDHNNELGMYRTHVYVYDNAGNHSVAAINFINIENEAPVISNVNVTEINENGYTVSCKVTDNDRVNRVQFPTWTMSNDQDDIASNWWTNESVRGTPNGDIYTFRVNISEHNNESGIYYTHIYAYDDCGNYSADNSISVKIDYGRPIVSDVSIKDIDETGYTVVCKASDNNKVNRVQFPTWTLLNWQDDIQSDYPNNPDATGTAEGDTYTYRVNIKDHNNESGIYFTHVYAYDESGNRTTGDDIGYVTVMVNREKYQPVKTAGFGENMYLLFSNEDNFTWDNAQGYCNFLGGHLVTINSKEENEFVKNLYLDDSHDHLMLGASDSVTEGLWRWITREDLSYTNWNEGEPNDMNGEDFAHMLKGGGWNDANKDSTANMCFICEIENAYAPEPEPIKTVTWNSHKYLLFSNDEKMTWENANRYCEVLGGHLVTISSEDENSFLLGLFTDAGYSSCLLGGNDVQTEGIWEWVNGEEWTYSNWDDNEPNNDGNEDYVHIRNNGKWNDLDTYETTDKCFVCEIENAEMPTVPPITDGPTVTVSSAKAQPGKTASVTVDLSGNKGFANLGIQIGYDASVLTLESAVNNSSVGAVFTPAQAITTNPYNMNWDSTGSVSFNGTLATLTFKVKDGAADGTYPVTIGYYTGIGGDYQDGSDVNYDADFKPLGLNYVNGSVTVSSHVPGDINGDGRVNNQDGTFLLRHLGGWNVKVDEGALDVTGDGRVNNQDGTVLLRYLGGWSVTIH